MKQPTSLVFVCQNLRDADNPKGSCMARGSNAVLERMKGEREGATYYGRIDPALGEALIREHVAGGAAGPELQRHRLPKSNLLDVSAIEGPVSGSGEAKP